MRFWRPNVGKGSSKVVFPTCGHSRSRRQAHVSPAPRCLGSLIPATVACGCDTGTHGIWAARQEMPQPRCQGRSQGPPAGNGGSTRIWEHRLLTEHRRAPGTTQVLGVQMGRAPVALIVQREVGSWLMTPKPCNYEEVTVWWRQPFASCRCNLLCGFLSVCLRSQLERKRDFLLSFRNCSPQDPGRPLACVSPRVVSDAKCPFRTAKQTFLFNNCIYFFQLSLFKEEY